MSNALPSFFRVKCAYSLKVNLKALFCFFPFKVNMGEPGEPAEGGAMEELGTGVAIALLWELTRSIGTNGIGRPPLEV